MTASMAHDCLSCSVHISVAKMSHLEGKGKMSAYDRLYMKNIIISMYHNPREYPGNI